MRKHINLKWLRELSDQGLSQKDIARRLGVSEGGVSKALRRINTAAAKDVALRTAGRINDRKLNVMDQLGELVAKLRAELDNIEQELESRPGKERMAWQDQQIKYAAELRKQISVVMDVMKTMYDINEVRTFQEVVIEEIGHADEETKQRIVNRLRDRRALGELTFPS
ncbi:MAG: winged helix-turn-helix transcriptional regulator [Pseudomonadota bacterium]